MAVNNTLNEFRAGVIAERQFAATALAARFTIEQWHARCVHLADMLDTFAELRDEPMVPRTYGRLAVALHVLEALDPVPDSNETDQ
jgi:deferrochelatase/peroxidase EfeB